MIWSFPNQCHDVSLAELHTINGIIIYISREENLFFPHHLAVEWIVHRYEDLTLSLLEQVYENFIRQTYDYTCLYNGFWQRQIQYR